MANNVIDWAFQFDIHYVDKLLLVAIADDADKAGVSKYLGGLKTIGKQCSLSPRQIRRSLRRLEVWGLIATYPQARSNGSDAQHVFQCRILVDPKEWTSPQGAPPAKRKGKNLEPSRRPIMSTFPADFRKALKATFDEHLFHTWLSPCEVVSLAHGRLTMRLPKVIWAETLREHTAAILEVAQQIAPETKKLHFLIPGEREEKF